VKGIPYKDNICTGLLGDKAVFLQRAQGVDRQNRVTSSRWIFPFGDLSVRQEGWYRLQFDVFEIVDGVSEWRQQITSKPFYTFAPKDFPGMGGPTETTVQMKGVGLRLRAPKHNHGDGRLIPFVFLLWQGVSHNLEPDAFKP
jgi:hypothetical protein